MEGASDLLDTFHEEDLLRIQTVGTDKGYFAKPFLTALFRRRIQPHIAAKTTGREVVHQRVRGMNQTAGFHLSQRARKKIEELWGRRNAGTACGAFSGGGILQVLDEAYVIGWLLNLKRLAKLLPVPA